LCFAGAGWGAVVIVTPHSQVAIHTRRFIMASYNRVILMGNLTRDPELKTLPSQTVVCDFALAVNRRWKDTDGGDREEVLFIDCAAFGKTGQTIGESLTKGRPIHIEGRLKFEQWEQEDGQRRSKIRVIVEQFRFVDRKPGNPEPAQRPGRAKRTGNGKGGRSARPAVVEGELVGAGQDIPI
jgi:single-strand DNA-binding protein